MLLMNRREFSALLPMLVAAPSLGSAQAQTAQSAAQAAPHAPLETLVSGRYPPIAPEHPHQGPRMSQHFLLGLLPDNIRLEAHVTHLAPGCPPEPIETHKHTEMWFIRDGTARLMTAGVTRDLAAGEMGLCIAGDQHTVYNASQTEPCSYFVVTVGPPE
jgi:mannose-6-phosphate isomerase-like protein (cupin superfamily)